MLGTQASMLLGLIAALLAVGFPPAVVGQTYELRSTTVSVQEGVGAHAIIEIVRTGDVSQATSVLVSTIDWTAVASQDYTSISQRREFIINARSLAVRIDVTQDNVYEPGADEQFLVTISSPSAGTITAMSTATVTIQDSNAEYNFEMATYPAVLESVGSINIAVVRTGYLQSEANVYISTTDCTTSSCSATPGVDFVPLVETRLFFQAGEDKVTVQLTITTDQTPENQESVYVEIVRVVGGAVGTTSTTTVLIEDDDVQYQINSGVFSVKEGNQLRITITKEISTKEASTIEVYTEDGTARVVDGDYNSLLRTVPFIIGQRTASVILNINDDNVYEQQEEFYVGIRNPSNGFVLSSGSRFPVYIVDNESVLSIVDSAYTVNEVDQSVTIKIRRVGDLTASSSVRARSIAVSATADQDFTGFDIELMFISGQEGVDLKVAIANDDVTGEEDEVFLVELYQAATSILSRDASSTTITIKDSPRLSTLAIVLIAVGCAIFLILIIIMLLCCCAFMKPSGRRDKFYYEREGRDVPGVDFPQEGRGPGPVATYIPDDRDERRPHRPSERRDVERGRSSRQDIRNGGPHITELPPSNRASRQESNRRSDNPPPAPQQEPPAPPQDRPSEGRRMLQEPSGGHHESSDPRRTRSMFNPSGEREPYWERGMMERHQSNRSSPNHYGYF